MASWPTNQLDRAAVQSAGRSSRRWPFRPAASLRHLLPESPACGQNRRRRRSSPTSACNGSIDDDAPRHIQERDRPTRRPRAAPRIDRSRGSTACVSKCSRIRSPCSRDQLIQAAKDDALARPTCRSEFGLTRMTVDDDRLPAQLDALGQQRRRQCRSRAGPLAGQRDTCPA